MVEDSQFVHCQVRMDGLRFPFCVSFMYGRNTVEERKKLWHKIPICTADSWIVMGDVNAVFKANDRDGGKPISKAEIVDSSQWVNNSQLEVLKQTSSFFTWTNNQEGQARIYSKIDHAFANEKWQDCFPTATTVFKWEVISDHCSCTISIQSKEFLGVKLFRFYNLWADHRRFKSVVMDSWNKFSHGTGLRALFYKLLRLKHQLKQFNKDQIGDIGFQFQKAKSDFQEARLLAQRFPGDIALQNTAKTAAEIFGRKDQMYHSFLMQRSKIDWIRKGDSNTAYFHAYLKKRRAENRIASFINEQGSLVDNFSEVVSHFLNHFRSIMGSPSSAKQKINTHCIALGPKLNIDQQPSLLMPFSHQEIRTTIFSIPCIKSPGPDGFGSGFFKDLIKKYGRSAASARCAIKIDISKAYDTVDWWFVGDLLSELCFPEKFIKWIMSCLTNTSYLFLMNGRVQNDVLLFCKGNLASVQVLREALEEFSLVSGLVINTNKSHVYFGGTPADQRNYWMGIFILPQSIIKDIEKLCRSFLWGVNGNRNKIHLASWNKVCLPKAYGGLGFRNGLAWNKAIFSKYIWAITERPDLLWVKWINAVYLKGTSFWSYQVSQDSSWYWKKLCKLREVYTFREIFATGYTGKFHSALLHNSSLCQQQVGYHRAVWCRLSVPKHRFVLWLSVPKH
ncbi:uncharacterized protein LOC133825211 [Humulus lupulus]|uniref:uncharacterized protein LOC133825211 n=1 Tax=Humulus lupulus TaxID=3486 RepID=UPI002B414C7C|nr:uncharacterized protein LOC133825211 [Humulus lupulus]